jgi:prolyl 4-hydroxylase
MFTSIKNSCSARCAYNNECHEDPVMKRIRDRLAKVTGIPPENSEFVQIVKYEPGQFYRSHHDYVVDQRDRR